MINAVCPICGATVDARLLEHGRALQPAVATHVKYMTPGWHPGYGICPACALRAMHVIVESRSKTSLHTETDPATTFPYYHPDEETVLGQAQRMPDYMTFPGADVTIAFLDSGFYPHPDFSQTNTWSGASPAWHRLTESELSAALRSGVERLIEYVDLTDDGERVGLDTPSLWDSAGDSWHGQMTTAIAAGNGLLSGGRFRGYAPAASILPIKIGRGGGRIPEEDILRGLKWLLAEDNWQRYGVRVVNISVGGDFPQDWRENPVCKAAHALAQRGVVVVAAAGNRGVEELVAPAQTPTVITVGGIDDHNRFWRASQHSNVELLSLYHHNFGVVEWRHTPIRKPELLALARWLPSPVLPPTSVFRETYTIDRLRRVLHDDEDGARMGILAYWEELQRRLHSPDADEALARQVDRVEWMPEVWHALRRRMNAHKWVHPYYQHVDGTSVAVAQVAAVAAQMLHANPSLDSSDIRRILVDTSLHLPHLVMRQTGAGLIQPASAVAAALRTHAGRLAGIPRSGTHLRQIELQKWVDRGKLALLHTEHASDGQIVYFGHFAPLAQRVSVVGPFNGWRPDATPLEPAGDDWWHVALQLPPGEHCYRFWVEYSDPASGVWRRDPENPDVVESGYMEGHSVVQIQVKH